MTHPFPEGEHLRAAVRYIAERRATHPELKFVVLVDEACVQFDLTPAEGEFLLRFVRESNK
ncbi:hypothetical protein HRM2_31510 [Desulforapulum autotrophicum HRM2]|uniref:Uncharacterized protein n=1 Tax=Desulforapulum autotrophicum (strain ATCC 43914 / DSM 3382 / VKM B-1955 / HRM2) TaxID=177437 RepID=C0QKZ4_DESAH|nr:hypothetical protein [Desulforapulum autotrophicum]ACN16234.1 hypothetical protein HRM2_31510 [Desulforapulum autotrophicum HRM2]